MEQLKELRRLQKKNERLRGAVSDPTLDKLIPSVAAKDEDRQGSHPMDGLEV